MSALQFGTGWRDQQGRARTLLWLSDVGWCLFDTGYDVDIIRRGVHDELGLRAALLGWEDMVDDPAGVEWVIQRIVYPAPNPHPECMVCQGEGWFAGTEGIAVRCPCGDLT